MKYFLLIVAIIIAPARTVIAAETRDSDPQPSLFTELLDYARLANAAYESRDTVARLATEIGNELTMYEDIPGLDVTFCLFTDTKNKTHWVAVRGTVNIRNTLVNLDLQLLPNNDIGIQLHSGFAETAKDIFLKIKPALKKGYAINITGHSLGGGVASILAMYLDMMQYSVTRVVTFGQPKVTNYTGAKKFAHLDILRVVTARDFVPLLPPVDVVDLNISDLSSISNVGIYWPLGQEIILLDNNEYSIAKGLDSMLRATKFLNKQPDMKNLQHHQMAHYLQSITNRQQSAKWIPYKNDFSIFSIFGGNP